MSYPHRSPGLRASAVPIFLFFVATLVAMPVSLWAGGTPEPGAVPLQEDNALGGGLNGLPDNENQLLGILGPDRGFGFGDYVSDDIAGLQSTIGDQARYRYLIEVPPLQTNLTVEIFDADTGAGDVAGTEEHDQDNTTGWDLVTTYDLLDPSGAVVASITLGPQDCDPVTVGLQTMCNNAWSTLGTFVVANPAAGHWTFRVFAPNEPPGSDFEDNNSYGVRAHDGNATATGTEYNVYLDTYAGVGQVYAASAAADPGFSRTHDFYPYVTNGCVVDVNDFDGDDNGDETINLAPLTPVAGANGAYSFINLSGNGEWLQNQAIDFTTDDDTTSYGLWNLRFLVGEFNFMTFYLGDESAADPSGSAGNGNEPNQQPEPGAIRLYLPADGSVYFGERNSGTDAVIPPTKPVVSHSWMVQSGADPLVTGATTRIQVTVTLDNPAAFPIQFGTDVADNRVATATVPTNGGQTAYVPGSAMINNSSAAAGSGIQVAGTGPWNLTFAPGVVDAGDTVTLTYDIDVTPTGVGQVILTGSGPTTGTRAIYWDETCADPLGGAARCPAAALPVATYDTGPLCLLSEDVTVVGVPGVTIVKDAGMVTDAGNGLFDVTYTVNVTNSGTTNLLNVQITDDLDTAFGGTATFAVTAGPNATGSLTANGSYNGDTDTNLLVAMSSTLLPGDAETITYTVRFDPNSEAGPFTNVANFTAMDPLGNMVSDNDDAQTPVPEDPQLAVTKTTQGDPVSNGGGSFTITYQVELENTGNVDLLTVQVTDDLASVYPGLDSVTAPVATGTLTGNGSYDGDTDNNLLVAASSTLPVGATETVTYTVTFDAQGDGGPYTNTANGSGVSPLGTSAEDSDMSTFTIAEDPEIQVTKTQQGDPVSAGAGIFTVTYQVLVENTGDVPLTNVQVVDDLNATFPAPATVQAVTPPVTAITSGTGTLTANAGYDGTGDTDLLVAMTSTLDVGAAGTITFSVTFDANGDGGPYTNIAVGTGASPLDTEVTDSGSTELTIAENPAITVDKERIGPLVDEGNGVFTATFEIAIDNTGDVDLTNIQAVDDLVAAFPPPASVVAVTAPVTMITSGTGTLTANPAYDGDADTDLLIAASSTLDAGASGTVTFSVTFDTAGDDATFSNVATVTGDSPLGETVEDSDTLPVGVDVGDPQVGIAKDVLGPLVDNEDGTFTVNLLFTIENLGALDLTDVQVTDDLNATFPAPASVVAVTPPVATGTLTANPAYDGVTDTELLIAASSTLAVGAVGEITISVTFDPAGGTDFENTAIATAESDGGTTTDISDDGLDPDSNGNGDPDEPGENDPTPINPQVVPPIDIPTAGTWALLLMALLLAGAGLPYLRRS